MDKIKAAHEHIREIRAHEWKKRYCYAHMLFRKTRHGSKVPDIIAAPEPTDEDLSWPEPMVTVTWPTGYTTMTLAAYNKLPAKDKKTFNKLGGLS